MKVELDHTLVPSRDKAAAARMLGELLGVPWAPSASARSPRSTSTRA